MKKLFSTLLAISLAISMAATPAGAFYVGMVSFTTDFATGETANMTLYVENESGGYDELPVFDDQGNQLYIQVGENEWEKLDTPIPAGEVARQKAEEKAAADAAAAKKHAEMEQTYHITLEKDLAPNTATLEELEADIKLIPSVLYEKVAAQLNKMGKKLRVVNMMNHSLHMMENYDGFYLPSNVQIEISPYTAQRVFPHEYGHLIFMTILPHFYSTSTLQSEWNALAGGEGPTHISNYAATSFQEDLAETFDALVSGMCDEYGMVKNLAMQHPDCLAIKKIDHMRQLLCRVFSLDPSVFPNLTPSTPSTWAKAEVDAYQNILGGSQESVVPYKGDPHATGYQMPATRVQFVYSIAEDMVYHLFEAGYFANMNYSEFHARWCPIPDRVNGAYQIPFTDVTPSSLSHTAISAIYTMNLQGVVNGKTATTFDPTGQITRQEAATILYRLCNALGYSLPKGSTTFADADQIAPWAREAVSAVSAAGIMSGVGGSRFDPTGIYTCEQSALCLLRTYNLLVG